MQWRKNTAAFFTGSALLSSSLAPSHIFMSPTFFSPLSFSLVLPLSPLSVRLLVFRTQQLPCPYSTVCAISEWSCLQVQPAHGLRWSLTTTSWLWLHGGPAHTQRNPRAGTWKREKTRKRWDRKTYSGTIEMIIATDVLWHLNKDQIQSEFSYFSSFYPLKTCTWNKKCCSAHIMWPWSWELGLLECVSE